MCITYIYYMCVCNIYYIYMYIGICTLRFDGKKIGRYIEIHQISTYLQGQISKHIYICLYTCIYVLISIYICIYINISTQIYEYIHAAINVYRHSRPSFLPSNLNLLSRKPNLNKTWKNIKHLQFEKSQNSPIAICLVS